MRGEGVGVKEEITPGDFEGTDACEACVTHTTRLDVLRSGDARRRACVSVTGARE